MEIKIGGEENWFDAETGDDVVIEEDPKKKVKKTRGDFATEKEWYIYCERNGLPEARALRGTYPLIFVEDKKS